MDYNFDKICREAGFEGKDMDFVEKTMKKFKKDGKILRRTFQIFVRGFIKANAPKGLNARSKQALEADKYKLHPDILGAILDEVEEINEGNAKKSEAGRNHTEQECPEDGTDEEEDDSALAQILCEQYKAYFGTALHTFNYQIKEVIKKTLEKIHDYSYTENIKDADVLKLLMKSLEDWTQWTDKENFRICPRHLCSDKVWKNILPSYIEKHPREVRREFD